MTVDRNNNNVEAAFKNCAQFRKWITYIDNKNIGDANDLDIMTPMYNFIEHSYNNSDTSESLWQFKRDEQNMINENHDNLTTDNLLSLNTNQVCWKKKYNYWRSNYST